MKRKNTSTPSQKPKPILFSDLFKIDKTKLKQLGIFNPILNFDTKLFVDPTLLKDSSNKIIKDAEQTFGQFFADVLDLLQASEFENDKCWREARRRVNFPEYKFTCIGYGSDSIDGSGSGAELNDQILRSAKEMVDLANKNPNMFLLLPLLEEGIGADRVSDMTQNIIDDDICRFTVEKMSELKIEGNYKHKSKSRTEYNLLLNPYSQCAIKLIPTDILSNLPLADSFGNWLLSASFFNQNLRDKVNAMVKETFHNENKKKKKETLLEMLKNDKDFFVTVMKALQESNFEHYDLEKDAEGLHRWLNDSKELVKGRIFKTPKAKESSLEGLTTAVAEIIANFKELIEEKEIWRTFWTKHNSDFKHVKELYSQMMCFMVCETWLTSQSSDIHLTREFSKEIKQPIFKFSLARKHEVIVLVKHSDNYAGLEETYNKQNNLVGKKKAGFYVVMSFDEEDSKQLASIKKSDDKICKIIEIDVAHKDSAQSSFDFAGFESSLVEYEGISSLNEDRRKGGLSSHQKNHALRKKTTELCQEELRDGFSTSALQLCKIVAERMEDEFPDLLRDFEPYKKVEIDGGDWTIGTFYNWCKAAFKQRNKDLATL
jgi:hypothetical protein